MTLGALVFPTEEKTLRRDTSERTHAGTQSCAQFFISAIIVGRAERNHTVFEKALCTWKRVVAQGIDFCPSSSGAMSGLRNHVTMGLLLLMCTLTGHCSESAPSVSPAAASRHTLRDLRRMTEIVKHVERNRAHHSARTEATTASRARSSSVEANYLRTLKTDRDQVVVVPEVRKKEKFLIHITGPLYFSPKCRKHVYRLYHHTRDCTIPAYFKRCARLLTRLAGSPQCTEG